MDTFFLSLQLFQSSTQKSQDPQKSVVQTHSIFDFPFFGTFFFGLAHVNTEVSLWQKRREETTVIFFNLDFLERVWAGKS